MIDSGKIKVCLWFDNQAEEAASFYTSIFENSDIKKTSYYSKEGYDIHKKPEGSVMTVDFCLENIDFIGLNGGPTFTMNPSISFFLNFDPSKDQNASKTLDTFREALLPGGLELMALDEYPFSKKYCWLQDRFGVSWQLMLTNPAGEERPFIIPSFLFGGTDNYKAEGAIDFYTKVFHHSKVGNIARNPDIKDTLGTTRLMFGDFMIENAWFAAMDSGMDLDFYFNEAISIMIECTTQEEIDYYWDQLTTGGEEGPCGWLKDKFGVSWQVTPRLLSELLSGSDREKAERVTEAYMQMKKIDLRKLTAI